MIKYRIDFTAGASTQWQIFCCRAALLMHPTHKGGRPVKHLSQNDVIQIEALAAMCTKGQIADYFGMTEKTFRAIEQRQPEVFTAYSRGKARAIADVGSALYQKALGGDIRAMQFYLKTQAGWSEKNAIELSTPQNNAWTIEIVRPEGISKKPQVNLASN